MPVSQRERLWLLGGAAVGVLLIVIGWFFFINPQNAQTSDVRGQVSDVRGRNDQLDRRITVLAAQYKNLATYQQQLTAAKLALPDTSGLPDFLRSLQALGNATLANVTSLTVGAPTDLSTAPLPGSRAAAPAATSGAAGGTGSGTASSTTSGTAAGSGAGSATAGTPAARTAPVYALQISAQVSGTRQQLAQFLTQLQSVQPRAVLITAITFGSGDGKPGKGSTNSTTLSITMDAFVAPSSAAEVAALSAAAR